VNTPVPRTPFHANGATAALQALCQSDGGAEAFPSLTYSSDIKSYFEIAAPEAGCAMPNK